MSDFALTILLKPFIAAVFMIAVALMARGILKLIPDGKLKQLLTRRVGP